MDIYFEVLRLDVADEDAEDDLRVGLVPEEAGLARRSSGSLQ